MATISSADERDKQVVVVLREASDPRFELEGAELFLWTSDVMEDERIDGEFNIKADISRSI